MRLVTIRFPVTVETSRRSFEEVVFQIEVGDDVTNRGAVEELSTRLEALLGADPSGRVGDR